MDKETSELIEKIEVAGGRQRNTRRDIDSAKLDCEIWLVTQGKKLRKFMQHNGVNGPGSWIARTDQGDVSVYASPSYTASLDAAMTLVPDQLKEQWSLIGGHQWQAEVGDELSDAATPALALCASALKARASL